jgi:predicted metalloprotease with PDZ domain
MHKFKVGQTVRFESNSSSRFSLSNAVPGSYEVRKQLPERNGEFEYHVKSSNEAHERVVTESQIRRAG